VKEEDDSQVTEPLKEKILKGHVHTIEEMKAWLQPFGYSNIDRINAIRRENKICLRVQGSRLWKKRSIARNGAVKGKQP